MLAAIPPTASRPWSRMTAIPGSNDYGGDDSLAPAGPATAPDPGRSRDRARPRPVPRPRPTPAGPATAPDPDRPAASPRPPLPEHPPGVTPSSTDVGSRMQPSPPTSPNSTTRGAPETASTAAAAACFRARLDGEPSPAVERTAWVLAGYRRTSSTRSSRRLGQPWLTDSPRPQRAVGSIGGTHGSSTSCS